jgi:hypothetical protein
MYGPEKEVFIPAEFSKALRIGQQLVLGRFPFIEKAQ